MATVPEDALAAMRREAERLAQQQVERDSQARPLAAAVGGQEADKKPLVVAFEVVDVRLTASTGGRWVAYGSLAWE